MVFKFLLFVVLTSSFVSAEPSKTQKQNSPKDLMSKQSAPIKNSAVTPAVSRKPSTQTNSTLSPPEISKARGVILRLHLSANNKRRQLLIQKLIKEGLTKDTEIERFNLQIYQWKKEQTFSRAFRLCKELLESSAFAAVVQHCEPDFSFIPTNSYPHYQEVPQTWRTDKNIRTCEIVKDDLNVWRESLSDYWAQEMIGADLARKKLEKKRSQLPEDKVLVGVMDFFRKNNKRDHGYAVTNLISSEFPGKHAVLPNIRKHILDQDMKWFSGFVKHTDKMLKKVDQKCGAKPAS